MPERHYPADVSGYRTSRVLLLAAAFALGLLLYLAIEPTKPWILLLLVVLVSVGADGVVRAHPSGAEQEDFAWTLPLLLLPALFTLAAGLFLEGALRGYWVLPGALLAGAVMGAILFGQYETIELHSERFAAARFILHIATYLTAFCLFAAAYTFEVSLVPASLCIGLATVLLCVELLREVEAQPLHLLVYSGVVGFVVAEARWALYFLPLESYLAAVFLLLVFYLASGLVQHHLSDDLTQPVLTEFSAIALLGVAIVTLGRIFESGN